MKYTTNKNLKLPEYTDVIDIADINENFEAVDEHLGETIASDAGAHGFRYNTQDETFEILNANGEWEEISSAGGGGIALGAVTGLTTLTSSGKVYIKWTDPDNIEADGITRAEWAGTVLVRKAGSAPTNRKDGTIVLDSQTKNAYSGSYFCDSGLTDGTTYYYKLFPYTTTKLYTDSADNAFSATPNPVKVGNVSNISVTSGSELLQIKWTDPAATVVSDGVTLATWASTKVVYKTGSYPTSPDDGTLAINSTTRNAYSTSAYTISGLTNGTTYYIALFPISTDGAITTDATNRITGVPNLIKITTVPSQSGTLTYTGSAQSPSWSNYNTTQLTLGGTTSGTNASSYNATFTPKSGYCWSDGSTTAKTVAWTIGKAAGTLTLSKSSVTLNSTTLTDTVTVLRAGDGAVTATSDNTDVATVSVSGTSVGGTTFTIITISHVNKTTGTANITVKVAAGTNHTAPSGKTITVTAQFVSTVLDDNDWATISDVAAAGTGANYWEVGDCKGITVDGTVGTLAISGTYYVYILGFAHNDTANTIDFGTFKTAAIDGIDVCLIDSRYGSVSSDGSIYFNLNHWSSSSSSYNTNYGGWKGCDARYDILGSTDTAPSGYGSTATTSRTGYDASTTCATNPVANTLMAALPSDLRAVMKPMTVYTDNTGAATNTAACVTTSVDYLPLLAEYEIFGTSSHANTYEQEYQSQYTYYANGNSKVKYRHNETSSTARWWERSPNYDNSHDFCLVNTSGIAYHNHSRVSYGLSPAFRV